MFDTISVEYGIQNKVTKVVCDNASSMKKAIDVSLPLLRAGDAWADVEEDDDEEVDVDIDDAFSPVEETSELLRNCPQRIACFAHTVQLSVQDGLKKIHEASELGRALENVGKIVKSVRRSSVAAPLLRKEGITLRAAVKTRWNSELTMIESVLKNVGEVNKAIALLAPDNRRSLRPIHATDVTALNELIDLLQPFAEVTKTTEGDAVVTISSVVPAISYIERSIKSAKNAGARYTKHVLEALERSVNERLQQFKTLDNCVAALLDPSLKKTGLGPERDTEARREVERRFKVLRADKANSSGEDTPPNSPTKRRRMFAFLDEDDTPSPLKRRRGSARCPVEEYFGSPRDDGQEPLSFWREMAERECPQARTLAEVAREVLGLTATSASSERLFSVAGNILRDRRLNLRPTTFENLVILACNSDLFDSL